MVIREVTDRDEKRRIARAVLEALPEWVPRYGSMARMAASSEAM